MAGTGFCCSTVSIERRCCLSHFISGREECGRRHMRDGTTPCTLKAEEDESLQDDLSD